MNPMASTHAVSHWIDPEPAEPAPIRHARGRIVREVVSEPSEIDRYHNHESLSPEALSKALGELQASMEALEERVTAVEEGAASVVGAAKGLGISMLQMGDALSKRVRSLEEAPPPAAPEPVLAEPAVAEVEAEELPALFAAHAAPTSKGQILRLTLGLGAAVVVAVVTIVLLHPNTAPASAAPPAQVLYSPSAPAPGTVP
jgi:hypothetical protein